MNGSASDSAAVEGDVAARAERAWDSLLDAGFSVPAGGHFSDDFPVWSNRWNAGGFRRECVWEGRELLATASVRIAALNHASEVVQVAVVGAVVTAAAHRGKGLASTCVARCLDFARARGAQLAVLWGSEHSLYGRLGFRPAGSQWTVPLDALELGGYHSDQSNFKIHRGSFDAALFDCVRRNRNRGLVISEDDRSWFSAHRNVEWYRVTSPADDGQHPILAYAGVGRGIDLPGIVHEWGGQPAALRYLLNEIRQRVRARQILGRPDLFAEKGISMRTNFRDPAEILCLACDLSGGTHPVPEDRLWFWGLDGA